MNAATRRKFDSRTRYVQRNFSRWKKAYPNIIGAHAGKKYTGGRFKNRYSIVFLVAEKLPSPAHPIPKHLNVRLEGAVKKIPTDVFPIGAFELRSIALGDRNYRKDLTDAGTVGAFFERGGHTYACTNMHVVLPDWISSGRTRFFRPVSQQTAADVWLFNRQNQYIEGYLEIALFESIDAALIRVSAREVESLIRGVGIPTGVVPMHMMTVGMPVFMSGSVAGVQSGTVERMGVSIDPSILAGSKLDNLIITSLLSYPGDSGSPVYAGNLRLLGIAIGGTAQTTFVLPLEAIESKLRYAIKI